MKNKYHDIIGFLLIIIHIVGMVGLSLNSFQDIFLLLVPCNLLLTCFFCTFFISIKQNIKPIALIYFLGYIIEFIGVHTGFLFGEYSYGSILGFKIFGTPLIIGLNWLILILATHSLSLFFFRKDFFIILFASLLMVFIDLFIEPVAINLGFWSWSQDIVPFQNFIMWFVTSFIMHYILVKFKTKIHFKLGFYLFLSQLLFFIYLFLNL